MLKPGYNQLVIPNGYSQTSPGAGPKKFRQNPRYICLIGLFVKNSKISQ